MIIYPDSIVHFHCLKSGEDAFLGNLSTAFIKIAIVVVITVLMD